MPATKPEITFTGAGLAKVRVGNNPIVGEVQREQRVNPASGLMRWTWIARCPACEAELLGFSGGQPSAVRAGREFAGHLEHRHPVA